MTDRVRHLTVILDRDFRDDDVVQIVDAIRMIRHVDDVKSHVVTSKDSINQEIARSDLRREILEQIHKILYPRT